MNIVSLLGYPVAHSVSPVLHNTAFKKLGLEWIYLSCNVPPDMLHDAARGLRALGFRGANVTVPHKEAILPLLDYVDDEARSLGAVNTIILDQNKLKGFNTDGIGFLRSLIKEGGFDPCGKEVFIIGAGGAARAVAVALARAGAARICLANRTLEKANKLAEMIQKLYPGVETEGFALKTDALLGTRLKQSQLVVQTTSLGMYPKTKTCPELEWDALSPGTLVYDLVYNPRVTEFLKRAAGRGCSVLSGLGMLVYQGAASFKLWTGQEAPVKEMYAAALDALS